MNRFLPIPASAHAGQIDLVMTLVHVLMLVLFVGWSAYFLWVLFRFRRGRQPKANAAGATGHFALGTEVGVVIAEGLLLVVFALPIRYARTGPEPSNTNAIVVRVIGEQFAWNVHYPGADGEFGTTSIARVTASNPIGLDRRSPHGADDIVLLSELHLPINRQVIVQLSTKDVIHSFGVPAMRVKQDAIPGLFIPLWFTPTVTGTFDIACSQLCGLGHYKMKGIITVETEAEFRKFMEEEAKLLR